MNVRRNLLPPRLGTDAASQARRATPDSEAVVSSEDERPWPASTTFGKFPVKQNSVPGLPGGIWSTQKRDSFKLSEAAHRNAVRDVRLGAVTAHAGLRPGSTPSPSASESAGTLPFAIPLQPTPKTGRSLSHSQGQREVAQTSGPHSGVSHPAGALPLGLLAEEADTESESEIGSKLTHTASHPAPMRTATLPTTYEVHRGGSNGRHHDTRDQSPPSHPALLRGRTFESAFANLALEPAHRRAQWQSHLGWDDVPNVNESRRHSLADIPTRRGSLAAGEPSLLSRAFTNEDVIEDEPAHYQGYSLERMMDTPADRPMIRQQDATTGNIIPAMYRVPLVELNQHERNEIEARREQQAGNQSSQWGPGGAGRPRKQLYIVSFKCSRVDVFYLLDNTGLHVGEGDMVIVEADRGQDLGTVQHAKVTPDAARLLKKKYSEEQYKWLMMYSRNKEGGFNPNAQLHGENSGMASGVGGAAQLFPDAPATMQGTIPRDNYNNLKPKAIKRLANEHEIKMLAEKEGNEAKAKRTCQQKVAHLRLQMEILDAEWQWDFQKLIFYYYADHYINFKDLITELYRIYKTRIWLSAINPASFSQHAMGQPPSGIGPGAVPPYNPYALNNAYTMAYGEDRDPYGAQMPYRIPYDTYTPNYPAIPGVANSFAPAPGGFPEGQNYMFYGAGAPGQNEASAHHVGGGFSSIADPSSAARINAPPYDYPYGRGPGTDQALPGQPQFGPGGPDRFRYVGNDMPTFSPGMNYGGGPKASHPPWGSMAQNMPSMGRQAVLPNPIGTARPMSHGNAGGGPADPSDDHWKQPHYQGNMSAMRGMGLADSATLNESEPRSGAEGGTINTTGIDSQDERVRNLDRFFSQLPSPSDMRADDMSRER